MEEKDRILDVYSKRDESIDLPYFGYENLAHYSRVQQRYQKTMQVLKQHGFLSLESTKILDLGCGNGVTLRNFIELGAKIENVSGLDLRPNAISYAKHLNPKLDVFVGSATNLPWEDRSFDIVCQHTMFTSILDVNIKKEIVGEMGRVLRKNGIILWYDYLFDNPKNKNVKGVSRNEIFELFLESDYDVYLSKITLAPPIARRIPNKLIPIMYPILSSLVILNTHYIGVFRKL